MGGSDGCGPLPGGARSFCHPQVHGPQLVVILGPSGCGKTTLLNLLSHRLAASDGVLTLNGVPYRNVDALQHRIGFVAQDDLLLGAAPLPALPATPCSGNSGDRPSLSASNNPPPLPRGGVLLFSKWWVPPLLMGPPPTGGGGKSGLEGRMKRGGTHFWQAPTALDLPPRGAQLARHPPTHRHTNRRKNNRKPFPAPLASRINPPPVARKGLG